MEQHEQASFSSWRIALLGLVFLLGLSAIGVRLYQIQVVDSDTYEQRQTRQSVRRVLLPSPRGRILDRHGVPLADNRPNYCIALYAEELRRPGRWSNTVNAVDQEVDKLAVLLQQPRTCSRHKIEEHVARSLPLPLVVVEHADDQAIARITESPEHFPGMDIFVQPERVYPQGTLAAHVLGFVGRGDLTEEARAEDYNFHLSGMEGRSGLEKEYNDVLCGLPGGQLIRVDATGYRRHEWVGRQPVPGRDLTLTLDVKIQAALEAALSGVRGAGVVLDPHNGDVLALASAPTFDPNTLSPSPSPELWKLLLDDPTRPMFNRAIAGRYQPGSTFKPFVALAAQIYGNTPSTRCNECTGEFVYGKFHVSCAYGEKHGVVDMRKALEVSCNVYFCTIASEMGYEPILTVAQQAGFGRRTGIDLPGETSGLLPSPNWKRTKMKEGWAVGDTCLIAIGQGMLLASPLQMAVATAAIANGGTVFKPRIVRNEHRSEGDVVAHADWPDAALQVVRGGMADVISGEEGTGHRAQVKGLSVAAKTGTAEHDTANGRRKFGWMIAYAPVEAPRVAIAMVVEDAATGGKTVGPLLQRVLIAIFGDEIAVDGEVGR